MIPASGPPSRLTALARAVGMCVVFVGADLAAPGGAASAPAARTSDNTPAVILNTLAYWRFYLVGGPARISPEAMKTEAARYLKPGYLNRLRAGAMRSLKAGGGDPATWQGTVAWTPVYPAHRLLNAGGTLPPPANWADPSFDAGDWVRARRPFLMDVPLRMDGARGRILNVTRACYRTCFDVADPKTAANLTFRITYRGGVRLFVNGTEVGRGHLPAGRLDPETPALAYPAQAYYALQDEVPPEYRGRDLRPGLAARKEYMIAKETRGFFESLRRQRRGSDGTYRDMGWDYHYGKCYINRKGFNRLMGLRNRTSEFRIPPGLLRKGANLLALEVRRSDLHPLALGWGGKSYAGTANWDHAWILDLSLTAEAPVGRPPMRRPAGVQVWVEDIHSRLFDRDYCSEPSAPNVARIVAARNGTCGAQIVVGTDRRLAGLKVDVGAFRGPGGLLPASVATVQYARAHRFWDIRALGEGKGDGMASKPGPAAISPVILRRYYSPARIGLAGRDREPLLKALKFFDHLTGEPPPVVPADSAQPVWISLTVPPDTAAGTYSARATVRSDGMAPREVGLELEVLDWRVPDPKDFQTIMALEQSPYSIARRYKTPLWSDEHFRRMAGSFALLARAGSDFLAIPVLLNSEFGNRSDSPLRIIRKADGALAFDFAIVDRYLDLAIKHLGTPRCIAFLVDHAGGGREREVIGVLDETTGRVDRVYVGKGLPPDERRRIWRRLAGAIHLHMKQRGLENSTYWGLQWDYVNDPALPILLKEFAPSVTWVRYSHRYPPDGTYTWCANVRGGGLSIRRPTWKGWKSRRVNLVISRHCNSVWTAYGSSLPYACRVGPERALTSGGRGIGRMGADYWDSTWLDGYRAPGFMTGMPFLSLFWPGTRGAESSIRYEAMLEGLQEAEARIFLEQAAEKLADEALTQRVADLLDRHFCATLLMPALVPHPLLEEHASGWRSRSRRLYRAAAEVAGRLGVDLADSHLSARVPARGKAKVPVKLRNWTSRSRQWKLQAEPGWLRLERTAGQARPGQETLRAVIDAAGMAPGAAAEAAVTLTDVQTGRQERLTVNVRVSKVLDLTGPTDVANVVCGRRGRHALTLFNHSASALSWKIAASAPWAKLSPAAGSLAAGAQCGLGVVLAPPDGRRARHELTFRVTEADGAQSVRKLIVHVLPPYAAPLRRPTGRAVRMESLPNKLLTSIVRGGRPARLKYGLAYWKRGSPAFKHTPAKYAAALQVGATVRKDSEGRPQIAPLGRFDHGLLFGPASEVTYRIEGQGFSAFAVEVGWLVGSTPGPRKPMLHFEVFVDGHSAAQSGLMRPTDAPRLLVVEPLAGAKEIRLVTRTHNGAANDGSSKTYVYGVWGDPVFYRKQ